MSSDSEQESVSLKDRLKAKLKKAGVGVNDANSGEGEEKPRKRKLGSGTKNSPISSCNSIKIAPVCSGMNGSSQEETNSGTKRVDLSLSHQSVDSDEDILPSKPRVSNPLDSDDLDSDASSVVHRKSSSKKINNLSSGSDEDSSSVEGSDEENDSDDERNCHGLIDDEAEVSGTESSDDEEDGEEEEDEEGMGDSASSSDWESDWASGDELLHSNSSHSPALTNAPSTSGAAASSGFASDSSDGTSEKCAICLLRFSNQEVGTPESCDHVFCAECLHQWSKNVNTCPVDRQEFTLILVRRRVGGKVVRQIPVEKSVIEESDVPDDPTYCEVCGNCDREDSLLLCDECDAGYHLDCLDPPLSHVPMHNWYCSNCDPNTSGELADEVDFGIDEVHELLVDAQNVGTPQPRRPARMLPRTRQLERVLGRIRRLAVQLAQPSTSSGFESQSGEGIRRKRKAVRRKTVPKKRRKTTSKRSTKKVSKRKASASSGKKTTGKKRKSKKLSSKSKRRKRSIKNSRKARVVLPQSVKGRLAEQLGMRPPRQPWQTTPDMRTASNVSGIGFERSRAGIPTLHLFGQRDELDYFPGSDEEVGSGGGTAVVYQPRDNLPLAQRLHNRKRLAASLQNPTRRLHIVEPASAGGDLVESILMSQTKMLSKKTDVKINIDGTLDIKLKEPVVKPSSDPIKERLGENNIDVRDVSPSSAGHIVQAPMYSGGRRGGHNSHNNSYGGGGSYSGGRRGRGGGGGGGTPVGGGGGGNAVNSSGFRSSFNNPDNSRAQYEQFLGNNYGGGRPNPRGQPLRFRLNAPRRPLRRNAIMRRGAIPREMDNDDEDEESAADAQVPPKEVEDGGEGPKEDDDVDIYSDIEAETHKVGSGEDSEAEFGALLPPPEPPAILMNMGEQNSDEEGSDSELIIDDRAKGPSDETEDKYDPAEPCDDSDDGGSSSSMPNADEIPLPPEPGPALTSVVEYSDDSQQSIEEVSIKESTAEESSQDVSKDLSVLSTNASDENASDQSTEDVEQQDVSREEAGSKSDNVVGEDSSEDDDEDDCPNFSIYSAASVNIARQVGEDESDEEKQKVDKEKKSDDQMETESTSPVIAKKTKADNEELESSNKVVVDSDEKKTVEDSLLQVDIENSEKKALEDSAKDRDESEDSGSDEVGGDKVQVQTLVEEIFGTDDDSQSACLAPTAPVVPGLEGLETEVISDGEEAILDGDLSEAESETKRHKNSGENAGPIDFEDGEIVDETQRGRRERKREKAKKDEGNENINTSKPDDEKKKSRKKRDSPSKERAPLSSSENRNRDKDKEKEKDKEKDKKRNRDDDKSKDRGKDDISWKKPSKSTKDRNYRDGKEKEKGKDKDKEKEKEKSKDDKREEERENSRKDRKKKEKRKDLERYDVRKVLSDKTLSRQNKDAFGRDLDIRRRSRTHSRSKSRSRSRARSGRGRSRSRSRSHRRVGRSRTKSRSRGRSPGRSRIRHRSPSHDRSRLRKSRSRSRLRRSRSRIRNRSRSPRRSPNRLKDRPRKSRSKERARKRSRERIEQLRQRNDSNSISRDARREREQLRPRASWSRSFSRSWSRSWSPSLSGSPQYPMSEDEVLPTRSFSRSWSRERVEHVSTNDMGGGKHKTHKNLTVIVTNNKDDSRRKKKDGKRGGRRHASPAPSKEVFASGDNILVSVNFKSNKAGDQSGNSYPTEKSSKRKRDEGRSKRSKKDKSNRNARMDSPPAESNKPEKRRKPLPPEASQKPVAIIDLEQSPYKEFTPSPKDLIVLSDSEDDNMQQTEQELQQMKQKLHEEINAVPDDSLLAMGPKTPPEPQIKFSISAKSAIRTINNPLMEEEEEEGEEERIEGNETGNVRTDVEGDGMHKGPNTPPESPMGPATPGSSPTSPDAYDPFEPTASPRSESPDEGAGINERSGGTENANESLENGSLGPQVGDEGRPKTDNVEDTHSSSPKIGGETASPGTTALELDETDKAKPMSPSSSTEAAAAKTPSKAIVAPSGSTEVTSSTSASTARSVPQRSVSQTDRLLASVIKGALSVRPASKPSPAKIIPRQNGEQSVQADVIDMDLDSPYSPGSSEGDDLFEPPPVYNSRGTPTKLTSRTKTGGAASKTEKFDMLFGSSPMQRVKYSSNSRSKTSGKNAGRNQAKLNKIVKQMAKIRGPVRQADEDQLKILDEVPSSAVEMQVKDKFLKKLNRQERVVEEVKLALKPHYYKKHINKEDYKEILRRSVPKICHNKTGEINPIKIRTLVEAYVKKIRYLKKKAAIAAGQIKPKASKKQGD